MKRGHIVILTLMLITIILLATNSINGETTATTGSFTIGNDAPTQIPLASIGIQDSPTHWDTTNRNTHNLTAIINGTIADTNGDLINTTICISSTISHTCNIAYIANNSNFTIGHKIGINNVSYNISGIN